MDTRKKKGKRSFQPIDFDKELAGGVVAVEHPPELTKKTMKDVLETIRAELQLVRMGVSKHCAMALQFEDKKTPFCNRLSLINPDRWEAKDITDLPRLAFQDFGNKFADFVKDELRTLV